MPVKWRHSSNKSINALAGTGKTTCIEIGVGRMFGRYDWRFAGTEQQQFIWEQMLDYDGDGSPIVMSFGRAITDELKRRLHKYAVKVSGFHSYGASQLYKRGWGRTKSDWKVTNAVSKVLGYRTDNYRLLYPLLQPACKKLIDLARYFLLKQIDEEWLNKLLHEYEVDYGSAPEALLMETSNAALAECRSNTAVVDYTDMIYLPMTYDLIKREYGMVIVDEWQDTNLAQQEMARALGDSLCLFGDKNQAIYGFAGADWQAYDRLKVTMERSILGLTEMPLTISWRCSKSVVDAAKVMVADLQAAPNAIDGKVIRKDSTACSISELTDKMILCRTNAPLVSLALEFAGKGNTVHVAGADLGYDMLRILEHHEAETVAKTMKNLQTWYHRALANSEKRQAKLQATKADQYACFNALAKSCTTLTAMKDTIKNLFSDEASSSPTKLKSIHRAKGLEADDVVLWGDDCVPSAYATTPDQIQQEMNLKYVAYTRAKNTLTLTQGCTLT